jgi:hypothetical protein
VIRKHWISEIVGPGAARRSDWGVICVKRSSRLGSTAYPMSNLSSSSRRKGTALSALPAFARGPVDFSDRAFFACKANRACRDNSGCAP